MKIPDLKETDIVLLEKEIDAMNEVLPAMKHFILPGGNVVVSHCHIARCICRRAERSVTHLNEINPVPEILLRYLNRLSDYLFVLSRMISQEKNAVEMPWTPRQS